LLINKGSRDGLKESMPVVSSNMLLGRLSGVDSDYSKVLLLTDPSSVVNVLVEESRANGILRGEVGFNLKIESVSQDAPLLKGQRILTSGLGGTLPKGLIIGEVDEVISPKSEIFQSASIKPAVDFNNLEIIFVLKSKS
jgi:rod shape-determining protein MreC